MIMMWHHLVVRPIDRIVRDALCIFLLWGMAQGKAFGADLPQPGFGYPGRLEPYASMPEMQEGLVKFGMTAGRFRRDALPTGYVGRVKLQANELPYLLFSPRRGAKAVPMVVYFGGTGEQGTDLSLHFRQTVLFSRLTEAEFQKRHPCYIFAPMLPKGAVIRAALPGERSLMADLVCDALYAVIAAQRTPGVDTNRLYVTGLSWGGVAAFELACGFPGRFAACVPTACIQSPLRIPRKRPGNYWMLYNENSYKSEWSQSAIREIEQIVRSGGGDFRCSTFPDRGHDAWRKAWCEDAVWEWAFQRDLRAGRGMRYVYTMKGKWRFVKLQRPSAGPASQERTRTTGRSGASTGLMRRPTFQGLTHGGGTGLSSCLNCRYGDGSRSIRD